MFVYKKPHCIYICYRLTCGFLFMCFLYSRVGLLLNESWVDRTCIDINKACIYRYKWHTKEDVILQVWKTQKEQQGKLLANSRSKEADAYRLCFFNGIRVHLYRSTIQILQRLPTFSVYKAPDGRSQKYGMGDSKASYLPRLLQS